MSEELSESEARARLERIKANVATARTSFAKMVELLNEAREADDAGTLGYKSWTAYLADAFEGEPLNLPRGMRQQFVHYLAGEGVSVRDTAKITGASATTVQKDRDQLYQSGTVDPPNTTLGHDGKERKRPEPRKPRREYVREFCSGTIALDSCLRKLEAIVEEDGFEAKHKEQAKQEAALIKDIIDRASKLLAGLEG